MQMNCGTCRDKGGWYEPGIAHTDYWVPCNRCGDGPKPSQTTQRHELKCCTPYFDHVMRGWKTFEVRKNDRPGGFNQRDTLQLLEVDERGEYTGRECFCTVMYVLPGGQFGIEEGYVVLGLGPNRVCIGCET